MYGPNEYLFAFEAILVKNTQYPEFWISGLPDLRIYRFPPNFPPEAHPADQSGWTCKYRSIRISGLEYSCIFPPIFGFMYYRIPDYQNPGLPELRNSSYRIPVYQRYGVPGITGNFRITDSRLPDFQISQKAHPDSQTD